MTGVGAAAFIQDSNGKVLLVHHTYGVRNWELPGGGGEPNESPVETAVRETREETGLEVRAVSTVRWFYDVGVDRAGAVFRCEAIAGDPAPDGREISECAFFAADDLPTPISDWTVRRIEMGMARADSPLPETIGPRRWYGLAPIE